MSNQERWGVIPKFGTLIPGFGDKDEAEKYIEDNKMEGAVAIPLGVAEGYPPRQRELPGVERQPALPLECHDLQTTNVCYCVFDVFQRDLLARAVPFAQMLEES